MNLTINLSSGSIDEAIKRIENYRMTMQQKCQEFTKRLAMLGMDIVNANYDAAAYAGTNDIEVHLEFEGNKCTIVASGSALGFIEFGTGIAYPLGEYAGQAGAPPHGTYGQGRGASGKKWVFKGDAGTIGEPDAHRPGLVWTKGNPPANAFPSAAREMQEQAQVIAREVFRFD